MCSNLAALRWPVGGGQTNSAANALIDPRGGLEEKGAYKGRLVGRELNVEVFFFFSPFFYLTGMSLGRF